MKKFYFLLLALIVSVASVSAQYYFRGNVGNWGKDYPMEQNGNSWTITIPELTGQFKIAGADWEKNSSWGIKGSDNTISNPASVILNSDKDAANIAIPENEKWTNARITFTESTKTLTVEAESVETFDAAIELWLHGQFDKDQIEDDGFTSYKMTRHGDEWIVNITPTRSGRFGFKRIYNGYQTGWWAYGTANTTIEIGKEYPLTKETPNDLSHNLELGRSYRFILTGNFEIGFTLHVEEISNWISFNFEDRNGWGTDARAEIFVSEDGNPDGAVSYPVTLNSDGTVREYAPITLDNLWVRIYKDRVKNPVVARYISGMTYFMDEADFTGPDLYILGTFSDWDPVNAPAMKWDNGFYIYEYTGLSKNNTIKISTGRGIATHDDIWWNFNNNGLLFGGWSGNGDKQIDVNSTLSSCTKGYIANNYALNNIVEGNKYLIRIRYAEDATDNELAVYELGEQNGLTTGTLEATADDALGFTLNATATDATLNGRSVAELLDYSLDVSAPDAAWLPEAPEFAFGEMAYTAAYPDAEHTLTLRATPAYGKLTKAEFATLNLAATTATVKPRLEVGTTEAGLSVIDIEPLTNTRHLGHHEAAPAVYDRINTFSTDITLRAIEGIDFAVNGSAIESGRTYSVEGYNALSATPELPLTIKRGNESTSITIALPAYSSDETAFPAISSVSAAHTMLFFGDATGYPEGTTVYDFAIDYRFSFGTSTPAAAGYIGYKADIEGRTHSAIEGNWHKFGGYVAPMDEIFFAGSADNIIFRGIENYVYGAGDWARLCAESGRLPLHISDFGHGEGPVPTVSAAFNIIYPLLNAPAVTEKAEATAMTAAPRRVRAVSIDDIVAHNPAVAEGEDPYSADNPAATAEPITPEDYTTTGIGNVAVDTDAPAEYYNLQGVRIDRPAAGSVCIVRRGNTVSKTIVR